MQCLIFNFAIFKERRGWKQEVGIRGAGKDNVTT